MVLLIIYIIFLLLAFAAPRSKVLTGAILVFMCYLYAFAQYTGDLQTYEAAYLKLNGSIRFNVYEPGFSFVMSVCRRMGFSFTQFRLLLGIIICLIILGLVIRQTDFCAAATALYGIFPFFIYVSVMRSGVACPFVLLAIEQLNSGRRSSRLWFVVFIIIAAMFHYSSIIFLLMLIPVKKISYKWVLFVFCAGMILSILINYTDYIYNIVAHFTQRTKILQWFMRNDAAANLKGALAEAVLLVMLLFVAYRNNRIYKEPSVFSEGAEKAKKEKGMVSLSYKAALLMLFLLPLMIYSSPFMRLPYTLFLFFITTTLNAEASRTSAQKGTLMLTKLPYVRAWAVTAVLTLVWKFYYILPYMKAGTSFLWEFLEAAVV